MRAGQRVTDYVNALKMKFEGWVEAFPDGTGAVYGLPPPENATGIDVKVVHGACTRRGREHGKASGIFNFLCDVGVSIGISTANTIAQRHLQAHRNDLIKNICGASWLVRRELQSLTQRLSPRPV